MDSLVEIVMAAHPTPLREGVLRVFPDPLVSAPEKLLPDPIIPPLPENTLPEAEKLPLPVHSPRTLPEKLGLCDHDAPRGRFVSMSRVKILGSTALFT